MAEVIANFELAMHGTLEVRIEMITDLACSAEGCSLPCSLISCHRMLMRMTVAHRSVCVCVTPGVGI